MTLDERGRAAIAELQAHASSDVGIEAALAAVTSDRSPRRRLLIPLAAAAVVTLVVVTFAWARGLQTIDNAPPLKPSPTESAPQPVEPPNLVHASIVDITTGERSPMPRHIARIENARHFVVSPNGEQVAFTNGTTLYVTTLEPGKVRRVGDADGHTVPSWSADGHRLVYGFASWCVVTDLSAERDSVIAMGHPWPCLAPNFSPDGSTVLYTRLAGQAMGLWAVDSEGGRSHLIAHRSAWGFYSPDGSTIAFRKTSAETPVDTEFTHNALQVMTASGADAVALTRDTDAASQLNSLALWPDWSPSGTLIAYEPWFRTSLRIVNASGALVTDDIGREQGFLRTSWIDDETLIVEEIEGP